MTREYFGEGGFVNIQAGEHGQFLEVRLSSSREDQSVLLTYAEAARLVHAIMEEAGDLERAPEKMHRIIIDEKGELLSLSITQETMPQITWHVYRPAGDISYAEALLYVVSASSQRRAISQAYGLYNAIKDHWGNWDHIKKMIIAQAAKEFDNG